MIKPVVEWLLDNGDDCPLGIPINIWLFVGPFSDRVGQGKTKSDCG